MDNQFLPKIAVNAFAPSSGALFDALPAIKVKQRRSRKAPSPAAAEAIRKQRSALQRHKQRPQFFFWEPLKDGNTRAATAPSLPGLVPSFVSSKTIASPAHPFPGAEPLTRPPGCAPRFEIQSAGRLGFSSGAPSSSAIKSKGSRVSRPVEWSQGWFEDSAGVGSSGVGSGGNGGSYIGGGRDGISNNNPVKSAGGESRGERIVGHLHTEQNTRQQVFRSDSDEQQVQRHAVQMSNGFIGIEIIGGNQEGTDFKECDNTKKGVIRGGTSTSHDSSNPEFFAPASQEHGVLLDNEPQQQSGNRTLQSAPRATTHFSSMPQPECGPASFSGFDSLPPSKDGTSLPFEHAVSQSTGISAPTSLEHSLTSRDVTHTFESELSAFFSATGDDLMVLEVNIQQPSKRTVLSPLERDASLSFDGNVSQLPRHQILQSKQPNFDILPSSEAQRSNFSMENESSQSPERNALPHGDNDTGPQTNAGDIKSALPLDWGAVLPLEANAVLSSESNTRPLLNYDTTPAPDDRTVQPFESNPSSPSQVNSSMPSKLDNFRQAAPPQSGVEDVLPDELQVSLPSSESDATTPFEVASMPSPGENLLQSSEQNASSLATPHVLSPLAKNDFPPEFTKNGAHLSSAENIASQTSDGNASPLTGDIPVPAPPNSNASQAFESAVSLTSERNALSLSEPSDSTLETASVPLEQASSQSKLEATQLQTRHDLSLVEPAVPRLISETGSASSPANMDTSQPNIIAVPSPNLPVPTADTPPPSTEVELASEPGVPQERAHLKPGIEVPVDVSAEDAGSALQRELKKAQMERDRRREAAKEARAKKRNRAMGRIAAAKALADGTTEAASTNGELSLPPNAPNATTSVAHASSISMEAGPGFAEAHTDSSLVQAPAESQGLAEVIPSEAAEGATAHGKATSIEARIGSSLLQPSSIEVTEAAFPSKLTESATNDGTEACTEARSAVASGTEASGRVHADSSFVQASAETESTKGTFPGKTSEGDLATSVAVEEESASAKLPTLIKSASIVDNAAMVAAAALAAWTAAEALANASHDDDDDENATVSKGRSHSSSKGSFRERRGSSTNESVVRKSFDKNDPTVDELATKAGESSIEIINVSSSNEESKTFESGNTEGVESTSTNITSMAVERSASVDEPADPQEDPTTRGNTITHAAGKEDSVNGITASSAPPVAVGDVPGNNKSSSATAQGTSAGDNNALVNAESDTNNENYLATPVVESTSMVTEDSGSSSAAIAGSVTHDDNTIESNATAPKRGARGDRRARERGRGRRREKDATTAISAALSGTAVQNVVGANNDSSAAAEVTATTNGGVGSPTTTEVTTTTRNSAFATAQGEVKNDRISSDAVVESTSMVTEGSGASSAALAGSFTQDDNTIESNVPPKRQSRERGRGRGARAQSPDTPVDSRKAKRELERRAANEASAGAGIAAAAQAVQTQRALKEAAQEEKRVKSPDEEAKARAKAERAAKRAEAKAEAAAEAASKDSAAAGSAAAEQDWRQERQRQRSWHLSNAGSSFDTSSSASMVGSLEDSMSTSLESAAGGEIIIRDSSDGFLGGGVNGRNGGVHKSNSATLDHSPRALTHDEMVDFFFNSSAETSKATFASVQKEQPSRGMRVDGFGAPIGGRPAMKVIRKHGGVREIVPVSPGGEDQYQPTFTNRFENQGGP